MSTHRFQFNACLFFCVLCLSSCAVGPEGGDQPQFIGKSFSLIQQEIDKKKILPQKEFRGYLSLKTKGPVIPGIFQGAVPQGKAFIPEHDLVVISNYMSVDRSAALTFVSMHSGDLEKVLWVYNQDGSLHNGHMGGLAVTEKHLWIASGQSLYRLPLIKVIAAEDGSDLFLGPSLNTEVNCSFASSAGGVLFVGEFRKSGKRYSTKPSHAFTTPDGGRNHALMAGFHLDEQTGDIKKVMRHGSRTYPSFFISIPDKVQGAAFVGDSIVLSQSYGRRNKSQLSVYRTPFERKTNDFFTLDNSMRVPVWHLDSTNLEHSITAPPMSEGIAVVGDKLAVLYESGADKYRRTARLPQDRIHLLDLDLLMEFTSSSG